MANPVQMIHFPGADGGQLAARLEPAQGTPRAYALFAHCFTCSKDSLAATRISRGLAAAGIAVLRFDFTGLGGSAGDFSNTNFSSNIADLRAAADFLRETYAAPKILIGHSLGGAAVLAVAAQVPEAVAVATIAAPFNPDHVRGLLKPGAAAEIEARGEADVVLDGRTFRIRKQFIDDIAGHNLRDAITNLRKALLIFHGPRDTTVNVDNAAQIFGAAKHPKSFVSLDDADHLLTKKPDASFVAAVLAAWAGRYIGDPAQTSSELVAEPGTVIVQETRAGKFTQDIRAGSHVMHADEPAAYGGNDTGPSPYDLLLASLGACTAMTLRAYAELKNLPLERVTVRLKHDKIYAQDCVGCETKEGRIDRIEREIELTGALDELQRAKLLEISAKCPVHRTLHSEVQIPTVLKS